MRAVKWVSGAATAAGLWAIGPGAIGLGAIGLWATSTIGVAAQTLGEPDGARNRVNAALGEVARATELNGVTYDALWSGRIDRFDAEEWVWTERATFVIDDGALVEARKEALEYRVRPQDLRVSARVEEFWPNVDGVVLECCQPDCIRVSGLEDGAFGPKAQVDRFFAEWPRVAPVARAADRNYWLIADSRIGLRIADELNAVLRAQGASADCRLNLS